MKQEDSTGIEELIARALSGALSETEASQLRDWRNKSPQNEKHFQKLERMWRSSYQEPCYIHASGLKKRIMEEGFGPQGEASTKTFALKHFLRVAAAVLVCIGLGVFTYYMQESEFLEESVASEMILKSNPPGVKSRIMLPDGSVAWLNADSELRYRSGFSSEERFLELSGEAYFEVAKDATRPFIVKSENVYTRALGTSFNIRFYKEESEIDVSLLTGKVSVTAGSESDAKTYFLSPAEELNIARDLSSISRTTGNMSEMAAWKDNVMIFESAAFQDVVRSLERWYGVDIDASAYTSRTWDYYGQFSNQSLEQVLTRIGYVQGFDFTIQNDRVRIYEKGEKPID